jgi:two-component system chemotaxis response regulator CheB
VKKRLSPLRFRCHTGHAFTARALQQSIEETVEETLLAAIRSLEEHAALCDSRAQHQGRMGEEEEEQRLLDEARRARRRASQVHEVLDDLPSPDEE